MTLNTFKCNCLTLLHFKGLGHTSVPKMKFLDLGLQKLEDDEDRHIDATERITKPHSVVNELKDCILSEVKAGAVVLRLKVLGRRCQVRQLLQRVVVISSSQITC